MTAAQEDADWALTSSLSVDATVVSEGRQFPRRGMPNSYMASRREPILYAVSKVPVREVA